MNVNRIDCFLICDTYSDIIEIIKSTEIEYSVRIRFIFELKLKSTHSYMYISLQRFVNRLAIV